MTSPTASAPVELIEATALDDGSLSIPNAMVQRLMDRNLLHFEDGKWVIGDIWASYRLTAQPSGELIEREDLQRIIGEAVDSIPGGKWIVRSHRLVIADKILAAMSEGVDRYE